MLVYDTRERGSGQLGGRPQLIEKGLDKADRLPQTCHFSWLRAEVGETSTDDRKLPVVLNAP